MDFETQPRSAPPATPRRANQPLIIAIVGVLLIAGAGVLTYSLQHTQVSPAATQVNIGPGSPSFDVVRIDPKGNLVMAGRAQPGATVIILDGDKISFTSCRGTWPCARNLATSRSMFGALLRKSAFFSWSLR